MNATDSLHQDASRPIVPGLPLHFRVPACAGLGYLVTWVGLLLSIVPLRASASDIVTNSLKLNYAEVLRCGPNALFMFLMMSGQEAVSFEDLLRSVPISSEGASMLALRDVARRCGVPAEVRQYEPQEIDWMPLPALIQTKKDQVIIPHHFDVVYRVDGERVYLLDGTTGEKDYIRRSKLANFWTGYALIHPQSLGATVTDRYWHVLVGFLGLANCAVVFGWLRNARRRRHAALMLSESLYGR